MDYITHIANKIGRELFFLQNQLLRYSVIITANVPVFRNLSYNFRMSSFVYKIHFFSHKVLDSLVTRLIHFGNIETMDTTTLNNSLLIQFSLCSLMMTNYGIVLQFNDSA